MTPENKTILPYEIKKWIKGYADAHDFLRSDINEIIVKALTSLYQHLQENGRVAELEKTIHDLQDDFNELVISSDKEVERLKGLLEKIIRTTRFYLPNLSSGEAWQQFKTENNL